MTQHLHHTCEQLLTGWTVGVSSHFDATHSQNTTHGPNDAIIIWAYGILFLFISSFYKLTNFFSFIFYVLSLW